MPIFKIYNQAFTMTEVIVVLILVGIIAGFTIPNYRRSLEMEFERTARFQLEAVYKAEQLYRARVKDLWPGSDGTENDLNTINVALGLNINPDGMHDTNTTQAGLQGGFSCTRAGAAVKCTATREGNAYTLGICVHMDDTICCDAGTCPTTTPTCASLGC